MTEYKVNFDIDAYKETGRGYKVAFYDNGAYLWHQYCLDQAEADLITGDICRCGCADYREYTNVAGTWRQCPNCYLARLRP